MNIIIKSAKIIAPSSPFHNKTLDILIKDGFIVEISKGIKETPNTTVIEYKNIHISPGWFDPTVSFGEPGEEYNETIETGLSSAAAGGFTAVGVLPNSSIPTDKKSDVEFLIQRSSLSPVSIFPIGTLSKKRNGTEISETFDMSNSGAIAFGDDKSLENEKIMEISLLYNKTLGKPVISFPDTISISHGGQMNEGVTSTSLGLKGIPSFSEELRVARDLSIAEYTGGKIHFQNISTSKSVELIENAKKNGIDVTAQVTAHNILLDDSELIDFDTKFKVSPPLRTKEDIKNLVKGIKNGIIDIVSSDHRPKNIELKFKEFDSASFGTIGLETAFAATNTALHKELDLEEIISVICHKPRSRFGLKTPEINIGSYAELTIFNPYEDIFIKKEKIKSLSKNSIFLDKKLTGKVYGIIAKNKLVLNN